MKLCTIAVVTRHGATLPSQYPNAANQSGTPQLTSLLNIPRRDLPRIWDADFMLGPARADGTDSYVLGEITVSSVFPMPDEAPAEIARRVADRLRSKR